MKYHTLGTTGIEVSILCMGTWPFAGGKFWGDQDDRDSIATVHAALDRGINFFDTAEGYGPDGRAERVLGRALAGRREQAVIATKVSAGHLSGDDIQTACEGSLQRLQTDCIDLYQIHWPNHDIPIEETVASLDKLRTQGKIRAIGVSNFAVGDLAGMLGAGVCETNQLPYSLLWRGIEHEILPACLDGDVGILCYSSLAQGLLAGRYADADEVPVGVACTRIFSSDRPNTDHGEPGCEAAAFAAVDAVREISGDVGQPMAIVSLAWLLRQKGVTAALIGARKPEEIDWNLPAVDLSLSPDVADRLVRATEPVKTYLGRNCDMWLSTSRMR